MLFQEPFSRMIAPLAPSLPPKGAGALGMPPYYR
jgi:hypothetical protein